MRRLRSTSWIPILPIVIALGARNADNDQRSFRLGVAITTALALFAIIGTRDSFVAYESANDFADEIIDSGVEPAEFDGGAPWSAKTYGLFDETPQYVLYRRGPYWVKFYAVDTQPKIGPALEALDGYTVLERREYVSILHRRPTYLYLVRRPAGSPYFLNVEDF